MHEIGPVLAGVVLAGLAWRFVADTRARVGVLALGALLIGLVASLASGEFAESWLFVLVDAGLVALSAAVVLVALAAWARRGVGALRH